MKRKTAEKAISLLLCALLVCCLGAPACAEGGGLIEQETFDNVILSVLGDYSGDVSVGYYYSRTGESAFFDADKFMYSASLYKVPNCMLLEELENAGEITRDTKMYGFTVEQQEYAAIVNSDNDRGHDIVRYLGGEEYGDKCSDRFIKYTSLDEDYFTDERFTGDSYYTARFYTEILTYLFNHSAEYPHVLEFMKQTQPGHYLHTMSDDVYEIAQKYGEYPDKDDGPVYHAAGIIYCPTPIVVTVMTRNAGYNEKRFGEIAQALVNYTFELDEKAETMTVEATPEPTEEPQAVEPAVEPDPTPAPTPEPTPEPVIEHNTGFPVWIIVVCAAVFAGAAFLAIRLKPKKEKYTPKH